MLKHTNLLLHGLSSEQSVGDHLVFLTNTVSSVDGLVLNRRVPPWIVENHIGGGSQIKTGSTCFEGEHEYRCIFGGLKAFDDPLAVLRLAGEVVEWTALHFKTRLDDIKHRDELREDEHLVTFLAELIEQVEQGIHLSTFLLKELRINEAWVTTNLAQAHQTLKNGEGVLLHGFVRIKT